MDKIHQKATFEASPVTEEMKEGQKDARIWVEFVNTDVHKGRPNTFDIESDWKAGNRTVQDLKAMALERGSICFMIGVWPDAAFVKPDVAVGFRNFQNNDNCSTWWYKPVWD